MYMGNPLNSADIDLKIASILDSLLGESSFSLRGLSDASGVKLTRLGDVLRRGRAMTTGELQLICSALGVEPWRIMKEAQLAIAAEQSTNLLQFPPKTLEDLGITQEDLQQAAAHNTGEPIEAEYEQNHWEE